jgi:hypothetical protein
MFWLLQRIPAVKYEYCLDSFMIKTVIKAGMYLDTPAVKHNSEMNSQLQVTLGRSFSCQRHGSMYKYKRDWTCHVKFECGHSSIAHIVQLDSRGIAISCAILTVITTLIHNLIGHKDTKVLWLKSYVNIV